MVITLLFNRTSRVVASRTALNPRLTGPDLIEGIRPQTPYRSLHGVFQGRYNEKNGMAVNHPIIGCDGHSAVIVSDIQEVKETFMN